MQRESIENSISSFKLHAKLVEEKTEFPLGILKNFNRNANAWQIEKIKLDENISEYENKNKIIDSIFDIHAREKPTFSERFNHDTLFSALISKPARSDSGIGSFNLDIPDLPENASLVHWQIPNTQGYEWIDYHGLMQAGLTFEADSESFDPSSGLAVKTSLEDEGFCSTKCSPQTESKLDELSGGIEITDSAWSDALKFTISKYVDWEMRDE